MMEPMALSTELIRRFETTTVYSHPKATADVVLVHGLNGAPDSTWTASNGVFWPTQLLPVTLADAPANIIVYGYNADVATLKKGSSPTNNFVYHHAQNLVTSLATYRRNAGTKKNPIIWVCHSLGGIIAKRALLYSYDVLDPELDICRSIYVSTYAMIFLGTPHTGSNLASWAHTLQAMSGIAPRKWFDSESNLLETLKKDNVGLQEINLHFCDIYRRFKIHMVRENQKTDLKWTVDFVVDAESAGPQLPGVTYYSIEATHSAMCKFQDANAPGYSNVSSAILQWVSEAPECIQTRWTVEEEEKVARARTEIDELAKQSGVPATRNTPFTDATIGYASDISPNRKDEVTSVPQSPDSVSSMPSLEESRPKRAQSLVICPYRIRPNAHFKGRQQDLATLHHNLRGEDRRQNGTSSVLLQSLPGGGKSHLARQYVYLHGREYRGGIYWIPSRSEQEMEQTFWDIARMRAMQEFEAEPWKRDLLDPRKMVETVRTWFESFDDWLIVFDGIHFDTPGEAKFIPSAKNTSILYTSTNRAAHGNHEFNNPVLHELGRLSQKDAQELLLEEMGKAAPFSTNDLTQAGQAVDKMDRLPLMIHMAAQHLNETREPLVKYINSFQDRRKAGTLDAYKNVRNELERRGEVEALNLIYIMSFFAQNIPFEMLTLGLHGLDSRTPVKARDTANRRSLNNTLTVLIRWAVVGRNEIDDSSSTSSFTPPPSARSLPEPSDTVRVHSIIQDFFVDTLIECKEAPFWIERAITVFCHSYDSANHRILQDSKIGLPEDYRRYSIHGKQLLRRTTQLTRKYPKVDRLRSQLQKCLESIRFRIDELTESVNEAIMEGRPDLVPISIFDITNSFSDSDSAQTSQEPIFGCDGMESITFDPNVAPGVVDSPTLFATPDTNATSGNRYPEWDEIPMVKYPEDINMDSASGTPQQRSSSNSVGGLPLDLPPHRTVKRQEERRYHDHDGSMRRVGGADTDARINPNQQNPDSSSLSQFFGMGGSLSRQKSTVSSGTASPLRSFWGKLWKSPVVSESSLATTQVEDTVTPPSVAYEGAKGLGPSASTGASLLTRDSSNDSVAFQERLSRSDMGPAAASPPMWDNEPGRRASVRRSGQRRAACIDNEDRDFDFPSDQPPTNRMSVDMPSWPESPQPSGYTSQPMSRQTSDNPAVRTQGSTPRATPSRRRRPSNVETEPSPTLGLGSSGPSRSWDERHASAWGQHGVSRSVSLKRDRTLGTEVMGRRPGIEDSPRAAGIVTGDGEFFAFGAGPVQERRGSRAAEEDLVGIGLGITGGS